MKLNHVNSTSHHLLTRKLSWPSEAGPLSLAYPPYIHALHMNAGEAEGAELVKGK